MRARVRVTTGEGEPPSPIEAVGPTIRLGRDPSCELAIDPEAFPQVSATHARIEPSAGGFALVHLSRSNKTLLNDEPIDGKAPLRPGDRVRLGYTGPFVEVIRLEADAGPRHEPEPAPADFGRTVRADDVHKVLLRGTAGADRFEVGRGGVIGRDPQDAQFPLDHPHVSRLHASLAVDDGRVTLADLGSSNGTYVNGTRITRPVALEPGDRVDIGPFSLKFDGEALSGPSRSNNVELVARGLRRTVKDRATGQPLTLLDDVSLVVRPREFLALLGPSGSGKSTLLAMLSGRAAPDAGAVTVNGEDLYAHFEALKEDLAVVPQRDVLHEALPVASALRYTAELRLPGDTSREEVATSVGEILEVVGLSKRAGTAIRHLSGGQLKRASLANELIARPSLLFLDEVTSGLDEQSDRDVMDLFRKVADGGKTVVCITHNLANVEATCHLVAILTEGGRLAFVGTPGEAMAYFGVPRLGEIYRTLATRPAEAWQAKFRADPLHRRYVSGRLPAGTVGEGRADRPVGSARRGAGAFRQARVLTRRYLNIWRGDWPALVVMLGQSLMVAILLGMVFGDIGAIEAPAERLGRTVNLLLLLGVSCFWFGCNAAAKELVKERGIYRRERAFNLRVLPYLASKWLILCLIGVVQATLLFAVVRGWCRPPGAGAGQWATLAALAVAGTALGLLISAASKSEEMATALVPIAVIPQIILAGVIAPLKGPALALAKGVVTLYWGQQALERLLPEADRLLMNREAADWTGPLAIVLGQAALLGAAALIALRRSRD